MKYTLYFFILFALFGCSTTSEDRILGKWKISSWIRLENNASQYKQGSSPDLLFEFRTDSMTMTRSYDSVEETFTYHWFIQNDTLRIDTLEPFFKYFKIEQLDEQKMVLETKARSFFESGQPFKDEEITLTKQH